MATAFERNPRLALRLLKDSIASMRGKYALFFLVIMMGAAVNLLPPHLYKLFFQSIEHGDENALYRVLVFGCIVAFASMIATALSIYTREWLRCEIEASLRKKVLHALSQTSLQQLEQLNRGEWIACTSSDLSVTEDFLTASFPDQLRNALMFLGSCSLFLYYGGLLGALLLLLAVGLVFLNIRNQKKMQPALNEIRDLHGDVYQQLLENFEGLRTIRSYSGEAMVQNNFARKLKTINQKSLHTMRHFSSLIGTNELFILLGMTAVLVLVIHRVNNQVLSFDDALVYPFYMGIFFSSVAGFYRSNFDWTMFFTKGARLASLIYNLADPAKNNADDIRFAEFDQTSPELSFAQIDLRYPGHAALTAPFDLTIKKHELVAILGQSGCGKSTLLEFLAGLRPLAIDGTLTMMKTELSSYVEQKPYIFEGTIADNLRFGCNHNATDDELWTALEKAHLADLFRQRRGLQFYVHERGQNLSEGEKYRLGIARAILANKPFLLLDEPFAALDAHAIAAIMSLLSMERAHRGIVVVTHYVPASLMFDQVIDFAVLNQRVSSVHIPINRRDESMTADCALMNVS